MQTFKMNVTLVAEKTGVVAVLSQECHIRAQDLLGTLSQVICEVGLFLHSLMHRPEKTKSVLAKLRNIREEQQNLSRHIQKPTRQLSNPNEMLSSSM